MATCVSCGTTSCLISEGLGACADCLREGRAEALATVEQRRRDGRRAFHLPEAPPFAPTGAACGLCVQSCRIAEGERGFCGVRISRQGEVQGGDGSGARVDWYHDPLPTNCVADWICPEGSECGYPQYGHSNLAVFYEACSFDCLFCQNWHYRRHSQPGGGRSASQLADAANSRTACICFFGGDPTPQIQHALEASRLALERRADRAPRICWETNGSQSPAVLDEMLDLSLQTGGCLKLDLKAFSRPLHRALCGADNRRTLANLRRAAQRIPERPESPLVVASTLLIPGYVDEREVAQIAALLAEIDSSIPYALLGFHPHFLMTDLPPTSHAHAQRAERAARAAGLSRVRVGNRQLLGDWCH